MWSISQVSCLGLLILLAVIDARYKKVPQLLLIIGNLGAVAYQFFVKEADMCVLVAGLGVGIIFFAMSRITGEQIGYGDSWGILILGIFLGVWGVLEVLLAAFLLFIVGGIACMVKGTLTRKSTLPFFPFLAAGYFMVTFVGVSW